MKDGSVLELRHSAGAHGRDAEIHRLTPSVTFASGAFISAGVSLVLKIQLGYRVAGDGLLCLLTYTIY